MRNAFISFVVVSVVLMVGCSKNSEHAPSQKSRKSDATTEIVKVNCPRKIEFPAPVAGAPVDDILGIRQGAKLTDTILFLKCRSGAHFVFTEEGYGIIRDTHGQKFRQVVAATDGVPRTKPYNYARSFSSGEEGTPDFDFVTEKVMFWSLGLNGKEIVWGIWRSQFFKPSEQPAAGKLAEQLSAKYGQPNYTQEDNRTAELAWIYDSFGRQMSKSNNQLSRCNSIGARVDGNHYVFGECGLTISAYIEKSNNPLLADKVGIAIIDQGKYLAAVKDFEQTLAAAQTQQQSDEATKAAKSLPPVKF